MKNSKLITSVLFASFLLGTVSANAQQNMQSGSGMMRQGMMGQMMGGNCPMRGMMMGGAKGTFAAGRIAFLRAELEITDDQSGVFDAYSAAVKGNLQGMYAMRQSMMGMKGAKSPVERLDTRVTMMESRIESLKELRKPLEELYAALDEPQKKKANSLLTRMGCMM